MTLVFYKLQDRWWKEPALNLVAAAAQLSSFTHVELAIGSDPGARGQMTNVCRVFNDDVGEQSPVVLRPSSTNADVQTTVLCAGVELMARTGKNPQ